MSSTRRGWITLGLVSMIFLLVGQSLGERAGLLWGLAVALCFNGFICFFGDWFLIPRVKGAKLEGSDPWGLTTVVRDLAVKMRLKVPIILLVQTESPQAFIFTGLTGASRLILTRGLLNSLSDAEVRAVVAHLLAITKRNNSLGFTMAVAIGALTLAVSSVLDHVLAWLLGGRKSTSLRFLCSVWVSPLVSLLLKLQIRKKDYFYADQDAAHLIGDPTVLAKALWKLESYTSTKPYQSPPFLAPLHIVSPLSKKDWTRFFSLQPEVSLRIKRLIGHYPV